MDLAMLREQTRPEHEAVEAAVPLTEPDLTRAGYVSMLQRFSGVIQAWDTVAEAAAPAPYVALVQDRRRSGSLAEDLRFFHAEPATDPPAVLLQQMQDLIGPAGSPGHDSRFFGAMYVVEGSTLGGQFVAHHVETSLGLEPGLGDRFFRGYGKSTMPKWREFQQVLQAIPDAESGLVIDAAKQMFSIFQRWLAREQVAGDAGSIPPPERLLAIGQTAS